jgi:hypothetical protein
MGDIKMNGEFIKVNVNEPKITAVSYTRKGGTSQVSLSVQMFSYSRLTTIALQIRIYYIDDNNQLHKMCWSSNGTNEGWYRGSMGTALIKVAPKSLLAVNVNDQWLKVYHQRVGEILGCPLGIQGPMRLSSSLISINAII